MNDEILAECIRMSRNFEQIKGQTPFAAIVMLGGGEVGRGFSSVVADRDPTSHAEVNAIRNAANTLGTHELTDCVLYCSGFPCPLCLMAARWAGITQIHYAAELEDSELGGFEDLAYYQGLEQGPGGLGIELIGNSTMRPEARDAIVEWKRRFEAGTWE